jgi:hypothetical protein
VLALSVGESNSKVAYLPLKYTPSSGTFVLGSKPDFEIGNADNRHVERTTLLAQDCYKTGGDGHAKLK